MSCAENPYLLDLGDCLTTGMLGEEFKTHDIDSSWLSIFATDTVLHKRRSMQHLLPVPSKDNKHFTLRKNVGFEQILFVVHSSTNVHMTARFFSKNKDEKEQEDESEDGTVTVSGNDITALPFPLIIDDEEETTGFYLLDDKENVVIKITLTH